MALIKKTFAYGVFVGLSLFTGLLLVTFVGGGLYYKEYPNGRLIQWSKKFIHQILQDSPLSNLHQYAISVKADLKEPSHLAHSTYSFQKVDFPGTRAERSGGIISWIAPFSYRVAPNDSPVSSKISEPGHSRHLSLIGLRGETLSFQLVLRSDEPLKNLNVSLTLNPSSGSGCIQVHRFLEIYMALMERQGGKNGVLKKVLHPDPLVPFNDPYSPGHQLISRISTEKGKNQPIWLDVHFSRTCLAKRFSGQLEVRNEGAIIRTTPVDFTVLKATLPQDVGLDRWMQFYISRFWRGEMIPFNHFDFFAQLYHRYFLVAHQYGFATNDCGETPVRIQWDWNSGKPLSVNWKDYDAMMGTELSGSLTGNTPNSWCLPIPTYALGVRMWGGFHIGGQYPSSIDSWKGIPDAATQNLANLIVQHWEEKGWPISRGFVYAFDEPAHQLYYHDMYKLIAQVATSIHKGSDHKMRFMLTDAPWVWYRTQENHAKSSMYNKVDIWSPGANVYIPERLQKYQKRGKKAWFYQGRPPFIAATDLSATGLGFRMWFWAAWKYHSDGVFYWASNMWNGNSQAVNPYTNGGGGDGEVFYPGRQLHFLGIPDIDGPVPSIRMAQWRRGYEDYKYFYMLRQKGHGKDADNIVNALVKRALDDGGYIPYWRNPLWTKPGDWNHDPNAWHKARVSLAHEIEKLYGQ